MFSAHGLDVFLTLYVIYSPSPKTANRRTTSSTVPLLLCGHLTCIVDSGCSASDGPKRITGSPTVVRDAPSGSIHPLHHSGYEH